MAVILASQSPRRRELLERMGMSDFLIRPAQGEEIFDPSLTPAQLVEVLSRQKAEEISAGEKLLHVAVTIRIIFYTKLGNRSEKINNTMPQINTTTVRRLTPFHSFSTMPQILLKKTFSDIRMLHEKASITGESAK